MHKNVGRLDQILRIGIGISLIYAGFINESIINDTLSSYIVGGLGLMNIIVALIRHCPFYTMIGLNTCPLKNSKISNID